MLCGVAWHGMARRGVACGVGVGWGGVCGAVLRRAVPCGVAQLCHAMWRAPAVAGPVTEMAITRFRGPKTRGTFDHQMRNFVLFDFVSRKVC